MKISIEKGDDKCGSEHGPCVNSLTKAVRALWANLQVTISKEVCGSMSFLHYNV